MWSKTIAFFTSAFLITRKEYIRQYKTKNSHAYAILNIIIISDVDLDPVASAFIGDRGSIPDPGVQNEGKI